MTNYAYIDGDLVDITDDYASFDSNRRDLTAAKRIRKLQMRSRRDEAMSRAVPYLGNDYEVSKETVDYIMMARVYVEGGGSLSGTFKVADSSGVGHTADAAFVFGLVDVIIQDWKIKMDNYITKVAAIEAAATVDAVRAVTWE